MPINTNHLPDHLRNKGSKLTLHFLINIYSYRKWIWYLCLFMKQNCHFDRGLAQYKHAKSPLSFSGINTTLLGFPKRYTVIPRFWRPRFWRPSQIGDFIYLVSSWAHLLHTYNLDFGDFDFGDLNFDRSKKSPKSRDDCTWFGLV